MIITHEEYEFKSTSKAKSISEQPAESRERSRERMHRRVRCEAKAYREASRQALVPTYALGSGAAVAHLRQGVLKAA